MKGLNLRSLTGELHEVAEPFLHDPALSISDYRQKFGGWYERLKFDFGGKFSFPGDCHDAPIQAFAGFTFDEMCKIFYGKDPYEDSLQRFFRTNAQHEVVRKIQTSMWRWGMRHDTWNEVVRVYNHLRNFSLGLREFEIRLDYTTFHNPCGNSKYGRIPIDGSFAYLVYYKRVHVMTIGFSIQEGRRILVQQIQANARACAGNRWMNRLPRNRVEFVIELFAKNFPGYRLFLVDGGSIVRKITAAYKRNLEKSKHFNHPDECEEWERRIAHLRKDAKRLKCFYGDSGRFALDPHRARWNDLTHREILLES